MSNVRALNTSQKRKSPKDLVIREALDMQTYLPYRLFNLTQNMAFRGTICVDDVSIRIRDWRILALLAASGPHTNQELAEEIGLDATTVSRAVQQLKTAGVIDVRRSKRDRRMQLIALSQKGADVHDAIAPERKQFSDRVESCLSQEEKDGLYAALDKIDAFFAAQRVEHDEWE